MRELLRNLTIPLTLISYGLLMIAAQPVVIRVLLYVLVLGGQSLLAQVFSFLSYMVLNMFLLYLWFRLTKFVKNRELRKHIQSSYSR